MYMYELMTIQTEVLKSVSKELCTCGELLKTQWTQWKEHNDTLEQDVIKWGNLCKWKKKYR